MPKTKAIDLDTARRQLAADTRTDPLIPTVRWFSGADDPYYRFILLAKQCAAQRDQGDEWAYLEGRAWLEVGHADDGRSCKRAIAAFESIREPTLDTLRWRAHAGAISALAGNAKGAWERAIALYREVLAKDPNDASANLMAAECARRHVRTSLVDSPKMKKVGVPMLEQALRDLENHALRGEPLADRERGLVLALLGRDAEAVGALQPAIAAIASRKEHVNAWYEARLACALSLARLGRDDEAIAMVRSAAEDRNILRSELALRWMNAPRWDSLARLYETEAGLDAQELTFYAKALNQQGRFADCVAAIERWRHERDNATADDPHVTRMLATAKHGLGDRDAAKTLLREAFRNGATDAANDAQAWYGETLA